MKFRYLEQVEIFFPLDVMWSSGCTTTQQSASHLPSILHNSHWAAGYDQYKTYLRTLILTTKKKRFFVLPLFFLLWGVNVSHFSWKTSLATQVSVNLTSFCFLNKSAKGGTTILIVMRWCQHSLWCHHLPGFWRSWVLKPLPLLVHLSI